MDCSPRPVFKKPQKFSHSLSPRRLRRIVFAGLDPSLALNMAKTCGNCGALLDGQGPQGLCPRCLMWEGLAETGPEACSADATKGGHEAQGFPSEASAAPIRFGDFELLEEIGR